MVIDLVELDGERAEAEEEAEEEAVLVTLGVP